MERKKDEHPQELLDTKRALSALDTMRALDTKRALDAKGPLVSSEAFSLFWWHSFVRGGISGFLGKTAVQPLGRCKIVRQLYGKEVSFPSAIFRLARDRGPYAASLELWRGNLQAATKSMWFTAWFFSTKKYMCREQPEWGTTVASLTAAFVAQTLAQPFDQWLLHLVREKVQDRTTTTFAQRILANWQLAGRLFREGILFRGYWMTMVATVPYNTGLMAVQQYLEQEHKCSAGTAGAVAGCGMTLMLYWQDTLRRVRQNSTDSSWVCAKHIYARGTQESSAFFGSLGKVLYGVRAFYAGLGVTILKTAINNGVRFGIDRKSVEK